MYVEMDRDTLSKHEICGKVMILITLEIEFMA